MSNFIEPHSRHIITGARQSGLTTFLTQFMVKVALNYSDMNINVCG